MTFFDRNRAALQEQAANTQNYQPNTPNCECGRGTKPVHCHECGSAFIYVKVRSSKFITIPAQNIQIKVKMFHCRRCGADFFEDTPCMSPPARDHASINDAKAAKAARESGRPSTPASAIQIQIIRGLLERSPNNPEVRKQAIKFGLLPAEPDNSSIAGEPKITPDSAEPKDYFDGDE